MERKFEFALDKNKNKQFQNAEIPEYQTPYSAGADFFCAEEVVVPSIWKQLFENCIVGGFICRLKKEKENPKDINPMIVHTGIKASMGEDEVLYLYNRSSNPKKVGLVLANSVGVVDKDYYGNPDNDGEIMFAFYNLKPWDVTIKVGDRIGQGVFTKFYHPAEARIKEEKRMGGFGSTDKEKYK